MPEKKDFLREIIEQKQKLDNISRILQEVEGGKQKLRKEITDREILLQRLEGELVRRDEIIKNLEEEKNDLNEKLILLNQKLKDKENFIRCMKYDIDRLQNDVIYRDRMISILKDEIEELKKISEKQSTLQPPLKPPEEVTKKESLFKEKIQVPLDRRKYEKELPKEETIEISLPAEEFKKKQKEPKKRRLGFKFFGTIFGLLLIVSFFLFFQTNVNMLKRNLIENLYTTASGFYLEGNIHGAERILKEVLSLDPDYKKARNLMIIVAGEQFEKYYNEKNYEKAFPYISQLIKAFPDDEVLLKKYRIVKQYIGK